jgi:gamma-glutamyltranspeptidase/glutathione hydrolase
LVLTAAFLGLAGCGSDKGPQEGTIGFVSGFIGGAASDEPRAALAARDVLSAGGSAADAAVALYFTLAVTKPAQAGLGGGGVCVVFDPTTKETQALDFLPPVRPGEGVVPGNVRGMFALQAKYGKLRWESLVGAGERIARFGAAVSRSTARDLEAARPLIAADPGLAAVFLDREGRTPAEGTVLSEPELAGTLAMIRRAPQDFYNGPFAARLAAFSSASGRRLTAEAIRDFVPVWRPAVSTRFGDFAAYFPPTSGGQAAAAAWQKLVAEGEYSTLPESARLAAVANAVPGAAPQGPNPETSFVVADRNGSMVSCAFTMNRFFGTAHAVLGTGVVLAAPDVEARHESLAPMLVVNPVVPKPYFAASASGGGVVGTRALLNTALGVFTLGRSPAAASAAPRPDPNGGLVNTIYCANGIDLQAVKEGNPNQICLLDTDRRGFGLAQHD